MHTRIDETIARVTRRLQVGNLYVNRNMVGAVVGVQPFGGDGLSGTGPKAGGPLYLLRLLSARPAAAARQAVRAAGDADREPTGPSPAFEALLGWARAQGDDALIAACQRFAELNPGGPARVLHGPTGERNLYTLAPCARVLCLAANGADRLLQTAAVLAVGGQAVWPASAQADWARLPVEVLTQVAVAADWRSDTAAVDAVLLHGDEERTREIAQLLAGRAGPIVRLAALPPSQADVPLERLVVERALSINTAAAGGNASLMTLG